jgi:hypothetical protein
MVKGVSNANYHQTFALYDAVLPKMLTNYNMHFWFKHLNIYGSIDALAA